MYGFRGTKGELLAVFRGLLAVAGDESNPVEVQVVVADSRLRVEAGDSTIGEWPVDEVTVDQRSDGYHIFAEGEELVFRTQQTGFEAAVAGGDVSGSSVAERVRSMSQPGDRDTAPAESVAPSTAQPSPMATGNGMAVAALVLGIGGALLGLIPIFGLFAIIAGILGVVFGVVGRRRVKQGETSGGKAMATWGLSLGAIGIALGVIGMVIVGDAFNQLEQDLDDISQDLENIGTIDDVRIELDGCFSDGASGTVINGHDTSVDVSIEVYFYDSAGTQVDSSFDFVSGVRPGGRATWEAVIFGTEYSTCEAEISSAFES